MSDFEKINIYVPEHIGEILDNDANMFEIMKKDGHTVNKNRFLSKLLLGYHNTYVAESHSSYEKIVNELIKEGIDYDKSYELAKNILNKCVLPEIPSRKGKNPTRLSLKPTKETEGLIMDIIYDLAEDGYISQYFCRMLMSYCEKPFSEREQIVFRDQYELLNKACRDSQPISLTTIWKPKMIHRVIPYQLATGQEEMFNYLLCAEINSLTGKQEARTYRLNRIDKIQYCRESNTISDDVKKHLNKMLSYGPQYIINDDEESCVKITESGRKYFNRIYYGRPRVDRIEDKEDGYYYYFKGSKDQLFFYFRRFGFDAEIIYPESLREKMSEFHLKAYENYM